MTAPLVSILLLTRDGRRTLPAVLAAISAQKVSCPFDVVAVDSGSVDGTTALLRPVVETVIEIAPATFNHGSTRNLGIAACRGALVVLLAQDAEPDSETWLESLVEPLRRDDRIAGSYARQVPRDDATAVARNYLARYAASSPVPRVQAIAGESAWHALSPARRLDVCTFDNVCACVRRAVWETHPFPAAAIAEDVEWAKTVLLAGFRLAFVPDAVVRHSHDRSASYELYRTYLVHQQLCRLLELRLIPSLGALARSVCLTTMSHIGWVLSSDRRMGGKIGELPRALATAVARPLGQYLGARSADESRELLRVRGI
jgi:rhamnosyltransferase